MNPFVIVVGGAGYIGSHMVRTLLNTHYRPVVFDNLSTGHRFLIPEGIPFIEGDLRNPNDIKNAFSQFRPNAVMHFASSSIVPESVQFPLKYYLNNVNAFLHLLEQMKEFEVPRIIFSSTAAVYGQPFEIPIKEDAPCKPLNPYGQSKGIMEQILRDVAAASSLSYVIFRYFNAAGAHTSSEIGECHSPETHLIPNLLAAAGDETKKFTMYGNDYPTPDGTCIRDYVHVEDICHAHLQALRYLEQNGDSETFNLGTEQGYSVREVLKTAEKVTGEKIAVEIAGRRPGDPPQLIADSRKAQRMLGWKPASGLETILRSAYQWHEHHLQKKGILT